jgi:rhodanese-related sulfurtransferase/predicted transcriptional regulator
MPSSRNPTHELLEALAGVARALGSPHRLRLIEHLAQGERSVEALAAKTGLSVANASQHLQALRRAGLVEGRRRGKQVIYRVASDSVLVLTSSLRRVAEEQAEAVRDLALAYLHRRDALEPVPLAELAARLEAGLVTVLDVRPPDEFAAGHLPAAVNIPLDELEARLAELPPDREVVAYCRGPWCVLAFDAVTRLRGKGLAARRLDGGFPEWRLAGLPVQTPG